MADNPLTGESSGQTFKPLQLPPHQIEMVRQILKEQIPDGEVFAFGSRVSGKPAKYFDLDRCRGH